jgi:4-hydroxy-2-oxoheptanedioate aldolase
MQEFGSFGRIDKRCHKNIKKMAEEGITPVGMALTIPSPFMAELAAIAGFDFVWIDMEHNIFNPETVANIIRAADSAGIATMARIVQMDLILPLLDFGMIGFTIPHVHSADQARQIVDAIKYAPLGHRGYAPRGRAHRFGTMAFSSYMEEIANEVIVSVMIEDREGIEHCEEILDVPGIDYIQMGPGDLSQALDVIGQTDHPDVITMCDKILAAADKRGIKYAGTGAPYTIAEDKTILLSGLTEIVKKHRQQKS